VLRAGFTDALVTGIRNRWIKVRHNPIGMPANPTAPFEVVPMITYKKKNVAMTSMKKHDAIPYFPGLTGVEGVARKILGVARRTTSKGTQGFAR
jgi:hypothetical protein